MSHCFLLLVNCCCSLLNCHIVITYLVLWYFCYSQDANPGGMHTGTSNLKPGSFQHISWLSYILAATIWFHFMYFCQHGCSHHMKWQYMCTVTTHSRVTSPLILTCWSGISQCRRWWRRQCCPIRCPPSLQSCSPAASPPSQTDTGIWSLPAGKGKLSSQEQTVLQFFSSAVV